MAKLIYIPSNPIKPFSSENTANKKHPIKKPQKNNQSERRLFRTLSFPQKSSTLVSSKGDMKMIRCLKSVLISTGRILLLNEHFRFTYNSVFSSSPKNEH